MLEPKERSEKEKSARVTKQKPLQNGDQITTSTNPSPRASPKARRVLRTATDEMVSSLPRERVLPEYLQKGKAGSRAWSRTGEPFE
jgi:hypothetical protein